VVSGEPDAMSALSPSQLSLGKASFEDDTSFSKELDDLGSRHVVSMDLTSRLTGHETDQVQG